VFTPELAHSDNLLEVFLVADRAINDVLFLKMMAVAGYIGGLAVARSRA